MLTLLSIAAVAVVVFLGRSLFRRFGTDRIQALLDTRRAGALVVSRGELVDGNRHIEVAMALTTRTLFYEDADMQASLDLQWVGEVEYDTRVGTGGSSGDGEVLRLRCYSQCFEFILPADALPRWQTVLPARREVPRAHERSMPQVAAAM